MGKTGFVARRRHAEAAKIIKNKGEIALKRGISAVVALVCAETDADDERKIVAYGEGEQVAQPHHDVGFLEGDGIVADEKKIAQILFRGL